MNSTLMHGGNHICRGCGCTDDHACTLTVLDSRDRIIGHETCCWIVLDVDTPTGVCSGCGIEVDFDMEAIATMGRDRDGVPKVLKQRRAIVA